MTEYIDIVLTAKGVFCAAPAWVVEEGDLVGLTNVLTGENEILKVIAVTTDSKGGEHINMIEKYIGHPLPRITAKYKKSEIEWRDDGDVSDNDR